METTAIVISKAQFESSGMKLGNPDTQVFLQTLDANGYIAPSPTGWAKISSLISGRVKEINFSEGDYIKKGEKLFSLESNEIIMLQQNYAEAFNQLNALKTSYDRQKTLSEENISSQKEFISAESDYKTLLARTEGLKAQLSMINIDFKKVEKGSISSSVPVYAPIGGYLTQQEVVLGQYIEPQELVAEVIDVDKLQLNIHVFEKNLKEIRTGQQVVFHNPDDPEVELSATITHIGKTIDSKTKTVQCIAKIINANETRLISGLFVETSIITSHREALALPREALFEDVGSYYVFGLAEYKQDEMFFSKIPVKVGMMNDEFCEILDSGLHDILVEGGYNLLIEE